MPENSVALWGAKLLLQELGVEVLNVKRVRT